MAMIELAQVPSAQSFSPVPSQSHAPKVDIAQVSARTRTFFFAAGHAGSSDILTDDAIEAHMRAVWLELFAAMKDAGIAKSNLRSAAMYVTMGGKCRLFRRVRDQMLGRLPVPSSCIQVEQLEGGGGCVALEADVAL